MIKRTRQALSTIATTTDMGELVDLNDWAVNSLRDWADAQADSGRQTGLDTRDGERAPLGRVVEIERRRMASAGVTELDGYLRLRRTGARTRLSRVARLYIFTVLATRRRIAELDR